MTYSSQVVRFVKSIDGEAGEPAATYIIASTVDTITRNISNQLSPNSITFSFYKQTGDSTTQSAYSGRCIIAESDDGSTWTNKYTSSADESSYSYIPSSGTISYVRCTLYATGGTSSALNLKTVNVVFDSDAFKALLAQEDGQTVIDGSKILTGSIVASSIASKTITADQLATNSITTDKLASKAITTDKLASGSITTDKLAANAITASKLDISSVSSGLLDDGTLLSDVNNNISTLSSDLSGFKSTVSSTYVTKTDFDNLEIGTRNLILGTQYWTDSAFYIDTATGYGPPDGSIVDGVLTVPNDNLRVDTANATVTPGESYTVGVDIRADTAYTGNTVLLQYYDASGTRQSYVYVQAAVSTDWSRITNSFVPPAGTVSVRIGLRSSAGYANSYKLLKLEKGNKPTDWTPAPEDTESEITTINSSIIQHADQINSKVSRDSVISEINQTAESIKIQASKISLDGTVIVSNSDGSVTIADGSITADKINVTDLFAQDITATGTIRGVVLEGATGNFTGQLNANSGNVGSFIIMDGTLYSSAEHTVTGGSAVTVFTLNGNPALGEAGDGPPEIRFTGAYQGIPRSAAAWITVAGGVENSNGVTSFDRLELGAASGTQSGKMEVSSNGVHTNGAFSADSNITTGGNIGFTSPYSDGSRSIYCKWKDGSNHDLIVRSSDGLSAAVGWKGSPDYDTKLDLRSRTVRLINSSGTSTLSDERMKKDWTELSKYKEFYSKLEPKAFRYVYGSSGRFHIGYSAQSVEKALASSGLSNEDFGGIIKYHVDELSDDYHGYDEEYGLIYTEFVALNTYMIKEMMQEVSSLKSEIGELRDEIIRLKNGG